MCPTLESKNINSQIQEIFAYQWLCMLCFWMSQTVYVTTGNGATFSASEQTMSGVRISPAIFSLTLL